MVGFNEQGQDQQQQQQNSFEPSQYQPQIDHINHLSHPQSQPPQQQNNQQQSSAQQDGSPSASVAGKAKQRRSSPIPRIRRACIQCHSGKTKCSDSLPCQSCIKRGLANACTYPDLDSDSSQPQPQSAAPQSAVGKIAAGQVHVAPNPAAPFVQAVPPQAAQQGAPVQPGAQPGSYYYDYQASNSSFRAAKRPRPLTEEETAAITKNFTRGAFYIGQSAPIRIDPRLPVRLTLGEGDQVHFEITSEVA